MAGSYDQEYLVGMMMFISRGVAQLVWNRTLAVVWSTRALVPGPQASGLMIREGLHSKQG